MSGRPYLIFFLTSVALPGMPCHAADVSEMVRRAAIALQSDWAAAPEYAFLQRDELQRSGKPGSKTHQVVMIAGSDYYMPVAIDDRPLDSDQQTSELRNLKNEFERRNAEDPQSRQRRVENYRKQRDQNGALVTEFPNAFTFELAREETINGHESYALVATPRKRAGAASRAAKVLAGMRGKMWVEKENSHIIRAESNVIAPVSIFGIFARVLPGTHMELEMEPVTDSIWLVSRFSMTLEVSKLWFHSTQVTSSTYSDYRLNGPVLEDLLSRAQ